MLLAQGGARFHSQRGPARLPGCESQGAARAGRKDRFGFCFPTPTVSDMLVAGGGAGVRTVVCGYPNLHAPPLSFLRLIPKFTGVAFQLTHGVANVEGQLVQEQRGQMPVRPLGVEDALQALGCGHEIINAVNDGEFHFFPFRSVGLRGRPARAGGHGTRSDRASVPSHLPPRPAGQGGTAEAEEGEGAGASKP